MILFIFCTIILAMNKFRNWLTVLLLATITLACSPQQDNTNTPIVDAPKAHIEIKGSDTMVNLALAWTEDYQSNHPAVNISITGGGSGTGIAALLNNTVDIANASRRIREEEFATANSLGIDPFEIIVARDAVAIIVNPENPVDQLTLEQVSDIFQGKYDNWQAFGGDDRPIVRVSRESNSGTHMYFLETVLRLGNPHSKLLFDPYTLLLPSSEGIIAEVRDTPNAIGYDGLAYVTPEVKVLGIGTHQDSPYIWPSTDTVSAGTYPISRDLYAYTNGQPQDAIKDFIEYILSEAGQIILKELGFIPAMP